MHLQAPRFKCTDAGAGHTAGGRGRFEVWWPQADL